MKHTKSRTKKAFRNSFIALVSQFVSLICGFILPRLILTTFGSEYNGITSSISQFIECIVLLRAGVGSVTRASLYKPLATGDNDQINGIINATQKFMRRISLIFAGGLFVFACIYPFAVSDEFDWFFSFSLVLILGINVFAQNYFGITYQILIEADQKNFIYTLISIASTILNTIVAVILINAGAGIHIVKLGSAIVFTLNPLVLYLYAKKTYKLDSSVPANNDAISQRWDAFAQQVATFVTNNTDIVVLTLFSNLKEVSVYTVYYMIAGKLTNLVQTVTNGIDAAFGNILAKKENEALQTNFRLYEQLVFSVATFAFGCAMILIEPFVSVYTKGVSDVNYSRVIFGFLMCLNQLFYCIRLPYQMITNAAGHFKQTRNGAIFEALMNIIISVVLVIEYGLIGVTIGTLFAYVFRTIQYATYSSRNILNRNIIVFVKLLCISLIEIGVTYFLVFVLEKMRFMPVVNSYISWGIRAVITAILHFCVIAVFSIIFYYRQTRQLIRKIKSVFV